jgi:LmbE family N-acetylglucosaminyl deacetylase
MNYRRLGNSWFKILILVLAGTGTRAQSPPVMSSADILLGLEKLQVLGSVLYVGAHPDDENTRLLAWLSKEKLYRTGYLSLTRGDGGQNLIGNEQGVELGLIRTQELLAARRIDGAEQFFSRAYDFGFSKSTDEALQKWDRDKILSDVVWVIRRFRPDVIITRFPQDGRAGHGHHSASAVLAVEAFSAAADPARYPEQLKYVQPWQAKRILWNTFNFGGTNTTSNDQFTIDAGTYNPVLGKGYGEIAAESRSQHKSQGFGVARQRGAALEYFTTWKGDPPVQSLMDGVATDWSRVPGSAKIQALLDSIVGQYSLFHPGKSVGSLVRLYQLIGTLADGYWKQVKQKETVQLIAACSGLFAEATTQRAQAVQTDSMEVDFSIINRNGNAVVLKKISLDKFSAEPGKILAGNQPFSFAAPVYISPDHPLSQPYWLQQPMKEGHFEINDQELIGNAESAPSFSADFLVNIEGTDFHLIKPVKQKYTDPVKGELYEPVAVVPPVTIEPEKELLLSATPVALQTHATVHALTRVDSPAVTIDQQKGWKASVGTVATAGAFLFRGQEAEAAINLMPVPAERMTGKEPFDLSVTAGGHQYASLLKTIHYDHIPTITYFRKPVVNVLTIDLKTEGKKIGYIAGAGDVVPEALMQMGYEVTQLSDYTLATASLAQYDAIITGVRAYNIKTSLLTHYNKLMKYVENGGNLIVQYNTSDNIGLEKAKIGPYPFSISRTRVTDEHAAVKLLKPAHPVLNYPNKITNADFDGWIQERSIYHAAAWDPHYETIFAMHDDGMADDEGSLIIARYGKGNFVYTGLVFFRELPAGVPGAYRLLANIIALNHKKPF